MSKINVEALKNELSPILSRSNGKYDDMTLNEKLRIVEIAKEIREYVDNFIEGGYQSIKMWSELDIDRVIYDHNN